MIYRDVIKIKTETNGFYDITKDISEIIDGSNVKDGLCNVFVKGTTASLLINENDRMLVEDFRKLLETLIPDDHLYQHADNAQSHLRASMLSQSLTIPLAEGKMAMGEWQNVLLFEFDTRDRDREIVVTVQGV
ncbi:MAG: secondary thiamine-phosphate synthase enzyme YjbQ [Candidatus Aenigmatarchaeota archaeon]